MEKIESHDAIRFCKYCKSDHVYKKGVRKNKSGSVQLYRCRDCKRIFSGNFGFRYRRYSPEIVSEAIHLYYSGMSSYQVADALKVRGIDVTRSAVRKWVERYSRIASLFTDSIKPNVDNWYRADEVWVKIDGKKHTSLRLWTMIRATGSRANWPIQRIGTTRTTSFA